eukprot:GHVU01014118.1.p1 GENE.GHVU01014118.1~~GHVU01014118.1.p1  ORF type:complete len:466 (+),score=34.11 GHVU01014118.1:359-1756(+)
MAPRLRVLPPPGRNRRHRRPVPPNPHLRPQHDIHYCALRDQTSNCVANRRAAEPASGVEGERSPNRAFSRLGCKASATLPSVVSLLGGTLAELITCIQSRTAALTLSTLSRDTEVLPPSPCRVLFSSISQVNLGDAWARGRGAAQNALVDLCEDPHTHEFWGRVGQPGCSLLCPPGEPIGVTELQPQPELAVTSSPDPADSLADDSEVPPEFYDDSPVHCAFIDVDGHAVHKRRYAKSKQDLVPISNDRLARVMYKPRHANPASTLTSLVNAEEGLMLHDPVGVLTDDAEGTISLVVLSVVSISVGTDRLFAVDVNQLHSGVHITGNPVRLRLEQDLQGAASGSGQQSAAPREGKLVWGAGVAGGSGGVFPVECTIQARMVLPLRAGVDPDTGDMEWSVSYLKEAADLLWRRIGDLPGCDSYMLALCKVDHRLYPKDAEGNPLLVCEAAVGAFQEGPTSVCPCKL